MKISDKYVLKETEAHMLKIKFHYNGYFVSDPETTYKKGKFYELKKGLDIDEINIIDLAKLVKDLLGVTEEFKLWYGQPGNDLSDGLRLLGTDKDVIRFINKFEGHPIADLYVETTSANFIDHWYDTDAAEEELEIGYNEDNSDPDYVDEEDIEGDGDGSNSVNDGENVNPSLTVATKSSRNPKATTLSDFEDEDGDSSDLQSPISSEDESGKKHYPKFKLNDNDEQVKFEEGQIFSSAQLIRSAVKEYGMQSRKNVYFKKNESKRLVVKCMPCCSFHMRFSKAASKNYFQLAKLNAIHTCHRISKNRQCKTRWLAKKLIHVLKHTPDMKLKALQEECKNKWGVMLSKFKFYRAKVKALEMIQGAISEQYNHLRSYAEELRTSNPGSTVIIKTTPGVNELVFERMYVCLYACKRAFVTSCRPLIGLDGCFLKGTYGGQLLTAVGKDGNNQMMPIAFAIVEAETKDSWSWFIDLLLEDLNGFQYKKWSFISDQQKGLVPIIASTSDYVEHRLCVKHLYGNWRKKYPGDELKAALWAAARSTTMPEFTRAMDSLKKLNEAAWKDMYDLPASM
ncbi:hypothetical protein TSUD_90240 [Trifolium subterraneum]|uniref:MULE transposase domain-containing protein n=1 Tax=Trifolium subterraneum TaxID=3900 RepID=A0A2Z6PM08_TRISU|nr:hypothetical protein TSUD_90240 [Trifolium subterraneum]